MSSLLPRARLRLSPALAVGMGIHKRLTVGHLAPLQSLPKAES